MSSSKYQPPQKVVVNTSYTKTSGEKGGTPMFSRVGKQTIVEDLTFQDKSSLQVESTFAQQRRLEMEVNKQNNDQGDEFSDSSVDEAEKYDIQDLVQQANTRVPGIDKKGGASPTKLGKGGAIELEDDKTPRGAEKDGSKTSPRKAAGGKKQVMYGMMGGQKQTLQVIFENLKAEIQQQHKAKKKKHGVPLDPEEEKEQLRKQMAIFKSRVHKGEDPCYKIIQRPVSLNEGNYRINFEQVEKRNPATSLKKYENHEPAERLTKVPPCTLAGPTCTLQSRRIARQVYQSDFHQRLMGTFCYASLDRQRFSHQGIRESARLSKEGRVLSARMPSESNTKRDASDDKGMTQTEMNGSPNKSDTKAPTSPPAHRSAMEAKHNTVSKLTSGKTPVNVKGESVFDHYAGKPATAARFESSLKTHKRVASTRDDSALMQLPTSAGTTRFKEMNSYKGGKTRGPSSIGSFPMSQYYNVQMGVPKAPENLNNLYGSYNGNYSKSYVPAFNGTFRNRSRKGTMIAPGTTREDNNQAGKDAEFDQVMPAIVSPIRFHLQRKREIFHRRDGCMLNNANENRFVPFNDKPEICSKYKSMKAPQFEKWADHSLDQYMTGQSNSTTENSHHQSYEPNHELVMESLQKGTPQFERYISKEQRKEIIGMANSPNPYGYEQLHSGFHSTRRNDKKAVPFTKLMSRDNLYQRMHGLPKFSKEEVHAQSKKYEHRVDHTEFLPNSILSSRKRKSDLGILRVPKDQDIRI